jgi:hypothetical protein
VVYHFPPTDYSFYPRCPFYAVTGWQCPGCGATRALYSLLHGNLTAAWAYNSLFVAVLPLLVFFFAVQFFHVFRRGTWYLPSVRPGFLYGAIVVMMCFGVIRNL